MDKLIKALEEQRRACKREEDSLTRSWVSAVESEMSELAEVYNRVRHYHLAKKEVLTDVLHALKALKA